MFGFRPIAFAGSVIKQLSDYLRENIENGTLAPGLRLPPTRTAAQDLGIARNIVIEVYEQLIAEGYLAAHAGSGTYVAEGIMTSPAKLVPPPPDARAEPETDIKENGFIYFDAGTPDLTKFPRRIWNKYVREVTEYGPDRALNYGNFQGNEALREAIARYVYRMKGIRCGPDRILITSGTSEAFLLLASAFRDLVRTVYVEDPTIEFTASIFRKWSYDVRPVPVDHQGMVVGRIPRGAPRGLIVLTPSHQYPTGSILSIQRRQQVARLADEAGHYLVEDDYNSEFRHRGSPVPPLQLLSPSRVIYAGTFSKSLSPALRIGFLIAPPDLADRLLRTKTELFLNASGITQLALARFMEDGHFDRHVRKMRTVYKNKRIFLVEQCRRLFGDDVRILGDEAGMHVQLAFRPEVYGHIDWQGIAAYGVRLGSFDDYAAAKGLHPGKIVLGYGMLTEKEIAEGLRRIGRFIDSKGK